MNPAQIVLREVGFIGEKFERRIVVEE